MIATIRVVNIEEAKTAIKMLNAYLEAHGEEETPVETVKTEPKTASKPKKVSEPVKEKKAVKSTKEIAAEAKAKTEKAVAKVKQEEDEVAEAVTSALTLAAITAKAKEVRAATSTADVKEVIAKYTSGKLSTIKEEDYEAFVADLEALVA